MASAGHVAAQVQEPVIAADESLNAPPATRRIGPWIFDLEGGAAYQSMTDIDSGGKFAVSRWTMRFGVNYAWDRQNSVGVAVSTGIANYDFDGGATLGGIVPWERVENHRVSAPVRFSFGESGNAIIIPSVRWNGESGARWQDSQTYGLVAAAFWKVSPSLSIGPGFGVFSTLEDGPQGFPILAIEWDITDKWNLSTGGGLGATQGPGLVLNYKVTDTFEVGVSGRFERLEFRLDDNNDAAPGGIGKDESFPFVLRAGWNPNPAVSVSGFAGAELGGRLTMKDRLNRTVERTNYDPAPIIGGTISLRF